MIVHPVVAFQGELGAFGELAIRQHWPDGATPLPCATFADTVARVLDGSAMFATLPVENAIVGPVRDAIDAIGASALHLSPQGEERVSVQLCLMAPRGATLATLRDVHSHAVALGQCRLFFARHPWLQPVVHDDTAGAAREVAAAGVRTRAALASAVAAERHDLEIIAHAVQDIAENWTRFVVVARV
jgi:prephenate dehydratase